MSFVETAADLLVGTPLEALARRVWVVVIRSGKPAARKSLEYDRQTEAVMQRVLSRSSNCIDVGAHRGSLLGPMLKLAPEGTHLALEPIPRLAKRLRQRFPTVRVYQLALSDSSGQAAFHHVVSSPGRSGFRRMGHVPADARVERITVQTARLDDIVPAGYRTEFVKIDVEGAQLQVLEGATGVLTR
jgi:FkbM family methyltransferase